MLKINVVPFYLDAQGQLILTEHFVEWRFPKIILFNLNETRDNVEQGEKTNKFTSKRDSR